MAWYDKYFSGNADKKTATPQNTRRGGAGGNSTKKVAPKPAPKKKKTTPKTTAKKSATSINNTLTRQEKNLEPKVVPKKEIPLLIAKPSEANKPAPKVSLLDKVNTATDIVKPKQINAIKPPLAPKKSVKKITKEAIGYGEGQVDPKLAQAVNKPAPVPEKKADTLTRQEKKLDPKPVKKVKETPRLSTAVKDGPKFVRKYTGTKSTKKETHRYKRGTSFWDRMYSPKPKKATPKVAPKKITKAPLSDSFNNPTISNQENAEIDAAITVQKIIDNSSLNFKPATLLQAANQNPESSLLKTALNSLYDGQSQKSRITSVTPKAPVKPTATEKAKQAMTSDAAYKVEPEKKKATPKGGKPHVQTRTEPVGTPKVAEQNETATVYAVRDENVKVRTQKGSPSAEAFAYAQNVDKGMTSSAPKKSVKKPTAETLTRQEEKLAPKVAPKPDKKTETLTRQEEKLAPKTVKSDKKAETLTRQEKKLAPKVSIVPKATPKPASKKKVDTLTRQEKQLDPAPKRKSTPTPKPAEPKKRVDTLTRQEKQLDPTPKVHSTPTPKPTVPPKRVDTLTRQEKKLDPAPKLKSTPKPEPAEPKKPKATPKGGKPMIEQKLITKGNNVAHDAKQAADKRAEPAKKVEEDLALNKKLFADKYRNEEPSYNQQYWATRLAEGKAAGNENIQAELAAEQAKIGMKKAYSGDRVVTEDMKRKASDDLSRVTGSDATIQNGGVTATTKKSGLFDENFETTYDYKGRPTIVQKGTDPKVSLLGKEVRLGDRTSTTYVDGVEVATKTGQDPLGYDAKVTRPDVAGHIDDREKVEPITQDDISNIDNQIANEKDPVKLKELHRRRLALMRSMQTKTRHSSLLADADVKRANLMGIL